MRPPAGASSGSGRTPRDLSAAINVTGLNGDGGHVQVAGDGLFHTGQPALSKAPGPANDAHRYGGLFADLRWRGTFATVKWLDDGYGDQFGINLFLPPRDNGLASSQRNLAVEVGQDLRLSEIAERTHPRGASAARARTRPTLCLPGKLSSPTSRST